jgi:hypothetical protein
MCTVSAPIAKEPLPSTISTPSLALISTIAEIDTFGSFFKMWDPRALATKTLNIEKTPKKPSATDSLSIH